MSIELSLICFSLIILILIGWIANYFKVDVKFKITLLFFTFLIFLIVFFFGIDFYKTKMHFKAFDSTALNNECGTFENIQIEQSVISNPLRKTDNLIYEFKTASKQNIEFNGDELTQHLYPLLFQLQKNDQICFQYATDIKDWNGRYYLTQLTKVTAPLD